MEQYAFGNNENPLFERVPNLDASMDRFLKKDFEVGTNLKKVNSIKNVKSHRNFGNE